MADYLQPPDVTKRLRYYDSQFLMEQDFIDEQKYHIDRQRRHARLLHAPGIAEGLEIKEENGTFSVMPGTALDPLGRTLLLAAQKLVPSFAGDGTKRLYMRYQETATNEGTGSEVGGATRFTEEPVIFFPPAGDQVGNEWVLLAELEVEGGRIKAVKRGPFAGVRLPGSGGGQTLRSSADGQRTELAGSLTMALHSGNAGVGTVATPVTMLHVKGRTGVHSVLYAETSKGIRALDALNDGEVHIHGLRVFDQLRALEHATFEKGLTLALNASNVGVGTAATPVTMLHVKGREGTHSVLYAQTSNGTRALDALNNGEVHIHGLRVFDQLQAKEHATFEKSLTVEDRLTVRNLNVALSGGNLGVGTAVSADTLFHVKGRAGMNSVLYVQTADGTRALDALNNGEVHIHGLQVFALLRAREHATFEKSLTVQGAITSSSHIEANSITVNGDMIANQHLSATRVTVRGAFLAKQGAVLEKGLTVHESGAPGLFVRDSDTQTSYGVVRSNEEAKVRIVRGTVVVGNDGRFHRMRGLGFEVRHHIENGNPKPGFCWIDFKPVFFEAPTVVTAIALRMDGMPVNTEWDWDTRDNALVMTVEKERVLIKTGGFDGRASNRSFHFTVTGW